MESGRSGFHLGRFARTRVRNSSVSHTFTSLKRDVCINQAIVIPVAKSFDAYAAEVAEKFKSCGFYCDVETRNLTINKAVREAQIAQYNYFLVVGEKEVKNGTVTVRKRTDNKDDEKKFQRYVFSALAWLRVLAATSNTLMCVRVCSVPKRSL